MKNMILTEEGKLSEKILFPYELSPFGSINIGNGLSMNCNSNPSLGDTWSFTGFNYNGCGTEARGILNN